MLSRFGNWRRGHGFISNKQKEFKALCDHISSEVAKLENTLLINRQETHQATQPKPEPKQREIFNPAKPILKSVRHRGPVGPAHRRAFDDKQISVLKTYYKNVYQSDRVKNIVAKAKAMGLDHGYSNYVQDAHTIDAITNEYISNKVIVDAIVTKHKKNITQVYAYIRFVLSIINPE